MLDLTIDYNQADNYTDQQNTNHNNQGNQLLILTIDFLLVCSINDWVGRSALNNPITHFTQHRIINRFFNIAKGTIKILFIIVS
ncbi:hypothetical protein D3C81_1610150 [compost metagenome]